MTLDEVIGRITPADHQAKQAARLRQERLTKPPGSLGRLEALSIQLAGIFGTERPKLRGKTIIVAAGDHGVVAQGVTGYPQEVTAQMVLNFLAGGAAINVMARKAGVDLVIVDAGVAAPLPDHSDLRVAAVGRGTADITQGPAMNRDQAEACVYEGVRLALEAADGGADIIGTGDMGIGNTTSSSAIVAALTGRQPAETTGPGTGRNDRELDHKIAVVERALEINRPDQNDALDVLAKVGGFEIGMLAGVVLGGALARRVVVIDGFISGAAGLIAHSLCPNVRDYLVAAHLSAETGHRIALSHMGLRPLLDLDMRLGEGTGAVLAMGLIDAAAATLTEMATFDEAGVSDREPDDDRGSSKLKRLATRHKLPYSPPVRPADQAKWGLHGPTSLSSALRSVASWRDWTSRQGRLCHPRSGRAAGGSSARVDPRDTHRRVPRFLRRAVRRPHTGETTGNTSRHPCRRVRRDWLRGAAALEVDSLVGHSRRHPSRSTDSVPVPVSLRDAVHHGRLSLRQGAGSRHGVQGRRQKVARRIRTRHCLAVAGGALLGIGGLVLLGAAIVVSLALGRWISGMLGGMTGDTYGAVNELAEVTVFLLGISLFRTYFRHHFRSLDIYSPYDWNLHCR